MSHKDPPMDAEEFVQEIEDSEPYEVEQLFREQLDRAHEQGYLKARDTFICRGYSFELGSQREIGKACEVSRDTVSRVLKENGVQVRSKPDIFKQD